MSYLFEPEAVVSAPIVGTFSRFPVRRIYGLVRNHADHAVETGHSGLEDPFFFLKASDREALVAAEALETTKIRYPALTQRLHHEVELVVAIGVGGKNIQLADAAKHIYGYAVGLDMTRADLLADLETRGRPWCVGKSFEDAGVLGPITPAEQVKDIKDAEIYLLNNGLPRQRSHVSRLIWGVAKLIEQLSIVWDLRPGDLIFTGTPRGVAPVVPGDVLEAGITGLSTLRVQVLPRPT